MRRKLLLSGAIVLFLAAVVGGTVIGIQRWRAAQADKIAKEIADHKAHSHDNQPQIDKHVVVYDSALLFIRLRYVDDPDMHRATDGGLHGLLESLDANSSYLNEEEYHRYRDAKAAPAAGSASIGAFVSKRFGYGAIVALLPGSPAEQAGLQSGDIIESLNGANAHEYSLEELRRRLAGAAGSSVELSVIKARRIEPQKVTLTLAEVAVPPLQQQMLPGNIGYLATQVLSRGRAQEMAAAIKTLEAQGAKAFVLDLRDAAWGDTDEGAAVANLFVDHGRLSYLSGQKFTQVNYDADPQKAVTKLPLAVLVNHGTAGAAEICAAAIQDNQRGDLVGEKTFGDASVQRLIEARDGRRAMILTVAKFHSPSGKVIQENGVSPSVLAQAEDIAVTPADETQDSKTAAQARAAVRQMQLQKAVDALQNKIGGGGQ